MLHSSKSYGCSRGHSGLRYLSAPGGVELNAVLIYPLSKFIDFSGLGPDIRIMPPVMPAGQPYNGAVTLQPHLTLCLDFIQ